MKKLFAIFLGLFLSTTSVYAAFDFVEEMLCVNNAAAVCGDGYTHGSGCSANGSIGLLGDTGYCGGCTDMVNTTNGITVTNARERQITCNDTDKTYRCGCRVTGTTYSCAEGYNGTCTNPSDINTCNCTQFECPENSTCTSATDVTCNNGYYQKPISSVLNPDTGLLETTVACVACSENGTCTNNEIQCNAGYYRAQKRTQIGSTSVVVRDEYVCTQCPEGKSSDAGAIGSAECYIPAGTAFTTEIGSGFYSVNCFPE